MGDRSDQAAQRAGAAASLAADGAAAVAVQALKMAGVRPILLKGPALERWLYESEVRTYTDADILVAPGKVEAARAVLRGLGYELGEDDPPGHHAEPWQRPSGASIDLHRSLFGLGVPPAVAWAAVARRAGPLSVAGAEVDVPATEVLALIVALHAAQHGGTVAKPLEDLRRALQVATPDIWREAMSLATALGASLTFVAGLSLVPGGRELALSLGGHDPATAVEALGGEAPLIAGIERLVHARGARAKLRVLRDEVFPSAEWVRWSDDVSGRRPTWLWLAYVRRLTRLVRHVLPSARAWARDQVARTGARPSSAGTTRDDRT